MGLLDDAIRDHLELKRRRGADPAEIARLEQEALGPVRRERTPVDEGEPAPEPVARDHDDVAAPAAHDAPEQAAFFEDEPDHAEPDDATRVIPPAADAPAADGPAGDADAATGDAPARGAADPGDEPAGPAAAPREPAARPAVSPEEQARRSELASQPTTEYRVEDYEELELDDRSHTPPAHPTPEPPPAPARDEGDDDPDADPHAAADLDEDVLEETPDFLQETPEHDRLWFEQRPPRDFDFDD